MRSSKTPIRTVACVIGLGLVLVQAAFAGENQPIKFNASDQAAAKALTLKMGDLGAGWKGGATKPQLNPDNPCTMKRSDLVLTGAARSEFKTQGATITSESNILQSPTMVSADWQRTVENATFMACTRGVYMKSTEANVKVVSFTKLAFPKVTRYTARYRLLADYGAAGETVRVLVDMIFLGQGRSEISLIVSTPYADRAAADGAERRLAQILVKRIAA
jgi:hypothetical protein